MNYSRIIIGDLVNGYGCGVTLFVSGCTFKCPGCYNESAWDFSSGQPFTVETMEEILEAMSQPYVDHLSILGGEPLHYKNYKTVFKIAEIVKDTFPEKKIWLWTGFKFTRSMQKILGFRNFDIVIDGKYKQELPTTKLFRGSDNQKMWVKENDVWSLKQD